MVDRWDSALVTYFGDVTRVPMAAAHWQLQIWQTWAVLVAALLMNWLSLRQVQRCGYFQTQCPCVCNRCIRSCHQQICLRHVWCICLSVVSGCLSIGWSLTLRCYKRFLRPTPSQALINPNFIAYIHQESGYHWSIRLEQPPNDEMIVNICIAYCHEVAIFSNTLSSQTEREYSLQTRHVLTGPRLRLTAMPCPDLPFNGRHPRDPCNYIDHYSFTNPRGTEGWAGLDGWPIANALPTKWSYVNNRSGVDQGKSASHRLTS